MKTPYASCRIREALTLEEVIAGLLEVFWTHTTNSRLLYMCYHLLRRTDAYHDYGITLYSREFVAVFGHECGDVQLCLSTLGLALLGSIGLVLHVVFW